MGLMERKIRSFWWKREDLGIGGEGGYFWNMEVLKDGGLLGIWGYWVLEGGRGNFCFLVGVSNKLKRLLMNMFIISFL